jgi:F0F1-type ATP synthase epsilon subunit
MLMYSRFVETLLLIRFMIVSGGFAVVQPGSQLSINAVEGYALEDFSDEAVKAQLAEASKIAGGSGSEQDIAEAKIELEVSLYLDSGHRIRLVLTGYRC